MLFVSFLIFIILNCIGKNEYDFIFKHIYLSLTWMPGGPAGPTGPCFPVSP